MLETLRFLCRGQLTAARGAVDGQTGRNEPRLLLPVLCRRVYRSATASCVVRAVASTSVARRMWVVRVCRSVRINNTYKRAREGRRRAHSEIKEASAVRVCNGIILKRVVQKIKRRPINRGARRDRTADDS